MEEFLMRKVHRGDECFVFPYTSIYSFSAVAVDVGFY